MTLPLPVPTRQYINRTTMQDRSPMSPAASMGLRMPLPTSIAMSHQCANSCALTILKGDADHPVNAYAPIHQKQDASKPRLSASHPSRFATSFSNLRSASQSSGFDSSVNVHVVSDHGILLPFLDRPTEVKELLFDTSANQSLMYTLCSVFCGDPQRPTQRGNDERWDEMLELLIELDRPLLDDEDWLARLESLVMERSPALWAQLACCLGADGLSLRPAAHPSSSHFDSWALSSHYVNASHDSDSPLSPPSAASSDDDDDTHDQNSLCVSVEPLEQLPHSYSEQPAGKLHHSSLHESPPSAESVAGRPSETASGQASPGEVFAMSASNEDSALTSSLEDIIEEPGSSAQASLPTPRRARSHSGKFAALRISALSSPSPPTSRRASNASELGAAFRRDSSSSPLPTGAISPVSQAPSSREASPSRTTSVSFSKHRRLSMVMVQNNSTSQHQQRDRTSPDVDAAVSPNPKALRRQRGFSEASHSLAGHSLQKQPRRRAQSFARSFAELKSPTKHLEQLRAEHAQAELDRLAEGACRISLQDRHAAPEPAPPTGALGLHRDDASGRPRRASASRKRMGSVGSRAGASISGSASPSLPGLLPDGRTRHPSGSCGSRDLSESIAAFRATMGMSTSPSPSEHNFSETADALSDAARSSDSAPRKRKASAGAQLAKPTSRTANTAEVKVSRKSSPTSTKQPEAQFQQPKHMQQLESRKRASGTAGSGLALGGGFSLAKSGANFRRQSHESAPLAQSGWRSNFSRGETTRARGGDLSALRSPPAVHRRPGGFVSLAQEYERARHHRRSSETAFSIHSNAVASSSSSSVASLDVAGREAMSHSHGQSSDECVPRLELSLADDTRDGKVKQTAPALIAGAKGGSTPRASFSSSSLRLGGTQQGYASIGVRIGPPSSASDSLAPAMPLSPLQACRTLLAPCPGSSNSSSSTQPSPRSPTIVFPISPNPSISRAREFQKALDTRRCQSAFEHIYKVGGAQTADSIRELITTTERSQMPDEQLLEQVALRLGLVDHERARQVGGREAEEADVVVAEPGYADRWHTFAELCRSLGVGQFELSLAKKRCGPAIDLCTS